MIGSWTVSKVVTIVEPSLILMSFNFPYHGDTGNVIQGNPQLHESINHPLRRHKNHLHNMSFDTPRLVAGLRSLGLRTNHTFFHLRTPTTKSSLPHDLGFEETVDLHIVHTHALRQAPIIFQLSVCIHVAQYTIQPSNVHVHFEQSESLFFYGLCN